jgi:hypothetical protein
LGREKALVAARQVEGRVASCKSDWPPWRKLPREIRAILIGAYDDGVLDTSPSEIFANVRQQVEEKFGRVSVVVFAGGMSRSLLNGRERRLG